MCGRELPWFSVSAQASTVLRCCVCHNEVDLQFPSLDHHPSSCPACGVESVFVTWKDVLIQVVPQEAPAEMCRAVRSAQVNLDELEFISLVAGLTQIVDAVQAGSELMQ
jgi:hypothetical protein